MNKVIEVIAASYGVDLSAVPRDWRQEQEHKAVSKVILNLPPNKAEGEILERAKARAALFAITK